MLLGPISIKYLRELLKGYKLIEANPYIFYSPYNITFITYKFTYYLSIYSLLSLPPAFAVLLTLIKQGKEQGLGLKAKYKEEIYNPIRTYINPLLSYTREDNYRIEKGGLYFYKDPYPLTY
ncbi:hypothetical protein HDK77DRAFT_423357 [Phyllosticta capitalensis]